MYPPPHVLLSDRSPVSRGGGSPVSHTSDTPSLYFLSPSSFAGHQYVAGKWWNVMRAEVDGVSLAVGGCGDGTCINVLPLPSFTFPLPTHTHTYYTHIPMHPHTYTPNPHMHVHKQPHTSIHSCTDTSPPEEPFLHFRTDNIFVNASSLSGPSTGPS